MNTRFPAIKLNHVRARVLGDGRPHLVSYWRFSVNGMDTGAAYETRAEALADVETIADNWGMLNTACHSEVTP